MESAKPAQAPVTAANLSEGDWPSRFRALDRLIVEGSVAAELYPALVGLLAAPESRQRAEVVLVVSRLGAPVVPLLMAVLTDAPPEADEWRRAAVVALERLGPASLLASPLLRELTDDPWLGPSARSALAAIEPAPSAGQRGWPIILGVLVTAAALGVAAQVLYPAGEFSPVQAVVAVVGLCVVAGVWWTRPGSSGWVLLFVIAAAILMGVWVAGSMTGVFGRLTRVLGAP